MGAFDNGGVYFRPDPWLNDEHIDANISLLAQVVGFRPYLPVRVENVLDANSPSRRRLRRVLGFRA